MRQTLQDVAGEREFDESGEARQRRREVDDGVVAQIEGLQRGQRAQVVGEVRQQVVGELEEAEGGERRDDRRNCLQVVVAEAQLAEVRGARARQAVDLGVLEVEHVDGRQLEDDRRHVVGLVLALAQQLVHVRVDDAAETTIVDGE